MYKLHPDSDYPAPPVAIVGGIVNFSLKNEIFLCYSKNNS
jgi:hypothetical protein